MEDRVKIIQLLKLENDVIWQRRLLGLWSDGVVYECTRGRWEEFIPALNVEATGTRQNPVETQGEMFD